MRNHNYLSQSVSHNQVKEVFKHVKFPCHLYVAACKTEKWKITCITFFRLPVLSHQETMVSSSNFYAISYLETLLTLFWNLSVRELIPSPVQYNKYNSTHFSEHHKFKFGMCHERFSFLILTIRKMISSKKQPWVVFFIVESSWRDTS